MTMNLFLIIKTVGYLGILALFHIPTECDAATSNSIDRKYVWNTNGSTLYSSPSSKADSVGHVNYGESISILEVIEGGSVEVPIYKAKKAIQDPGELRDYQLSSNWVKVHYDNQSGYILDTYLSSIPPPDSSHDMGFIMEDYLNSLSPIILEKNKEQTDEFCARNTLHFDNDIQYTYTDFGPCEQCGHARNEIYFPAANKKEGIIMALHFISPNGLLSEEDEVLLKKKGTGLEIGKYSEYGQIYILRINPQENGILLVGDFYM